MSNQQKRYGLGDSCCSAAKRVVLTHRGLTSAGVVHAGDVQSPTVYCAATPHVLIRFLLGLDPAGKPVSATVEIVTQPMPHSGRKSKRIGYVQWSPKRSVTYYSSACTSQS